MRVGVPITPSRTQIFVMFIIEIKGSDVSFYQQWFMWWRVMVRNMRVGKETARAIM